MSYNLTPSGAQLPSPDYCEKFQQLKTIAYEAGGRELVNALRREITSLSKGNYLETQVRGAMHLCGEFFKQLETLKSSLYALKGAHEHLTRDVFLTTLHKERPVILRLTCCPDYPYDGDTGTYTPDGGLRNGVGLSAMTLTAEVMPLISLIKKFNIPLQIDYQYADIEADDVDDLIYSGLEPEQFFQCIAGSRRAAEIYGAETLGSISGNISITSSSMRERFSELQSLVTENDIPAALAYGLKIRRIAHYQHFYDRHLQKTADQDAFLTHRARVDISQHQNLARSVQEDRARGNRVILITSSIDALAEHLRTVGTEVVPVFRTLK